MLAELGARDGLDPVGAVDAQQRRRDDDIRGIRFAHDSLLEGSGFELSVPRQIGNRFEAFSERGSIGCQRGGLIRAVVGLGKAIESRAAIRRRLLPAEAGGATRAALSACERIAEQKFRIHLSSAASPANPMVAADLQIVRGLMVADSVTRRRLKLDQRPAADECTARTGCSPAARPRQRSPARRR